jgi:hypothetical protein
VLFPDLVKKTRLDKAFGNFFDNIAKHKKIGNIQQLLEENPEWLALVLRRPALVFISSTSIGDNISWSLDNNVNTARDGDVGRPLFMDQVLVPLTESAELEFYDNNRGNLVTLQISGTVQEILKAIYSVCRDRDSGFFQGIECVKAGKYRAGKYKAGKYYLFIGS